MFAKFYIFWIRCRYHSAAIATAIMLIIAIRANAWEDHPDHDDHLKEIEIYKVIDRLTPEQIERCMELIEKDEIERNNV